MPNLILGDSLDVLKTLPENSIDSLVTDPPAGIAFMGKSWDSDKGGREHWIAWMTEIMREALRVMKPGAHGLVWGLPRTSHWTATALENAGFEIRDVVTHLFGSGFPKSLDISKAIDKAAGAERVMIGLKDNKGRAQANVYAGQWNTNNEGDPITAPSTPEAKQWSGFGTALKPSVEFYILIRKPLSEKTVAANVLKHGAGGLNIDASRIGYGETENIDFSRVQDGNIYGSQGIYGKATQKETTPLFKPTGRFPSHLVLDEEAASLLDEQSGILKTGGGKKHTRNDDGGIFKAHSPDDKIFSPSEGGASRFYYVAKASKSDKNFGLDDMPDVSQGAYGKFKGDGRGRQTEHSPTKNHHPTVKSTKLMQYLIKLITPPNGVVLDCFAGSGSTGVAALRAGFEFIGIEKEPEYFEIASKRLDANKESEPL